MSSLKLILHCLLLFIFSLTARAEPWMTGPYLFDSALVASVGSHNVDVLYQSLNTPSIYADSGAVIPIPLATSDFLALQYTTGLSSFSDLELITTYVRNQTEGNSSNNLGDTLMELGFQVLTQGTSHSRPNFRIAILELFPTGRYFQLKPSLFGTDATGAGSYQTSVEFAFNLLTQLQGTEHYLRASASAIATISSVVPLRGDSIYGGSPTTRGYINPGNAISIDLAAEYALTQNWVLDVETLVLAQRASNFKGYIGPNGSDFGAFIRNDPNAKQSNHIRPTRFNINNVQGIGSGNLYELTLSPGIEYNFSEHVGILLGCWISVEGKNTPNFFSSTFKLNLVY